MAAERYYVRGFAFRGIPTVSLFPPSPSVDRRNIKSDGEGEGKKVIRWNCSMRGKKPSSACG